MKLGEVLKKERERRGLSVAAIAEALSVDREEILEMESGDPVYETWGPHLAELAIAFAIPASRLVSESGRAENAEAGNVGRLVAALRIRSGWSPADIAEAAGVTRQVYDEIESGSSPLEAVAPRLLAFSEQVKVPVFNLFYPCGLRLVDLDDYP